MHAGVLALVQFLPLLLQASTTCLSALDSHLQAAGKQLEGVAEWEEHPLRVYTSYSATLSDSAHLLHVPLKRQKRPKARRATAARMYIKTAPRSHL